MRCFLRSVDQTRPDIEIPTNETVIIGRVQQFALADARVSRQHLEVSVQMSDQTISLTLLGQNPSTLNGRRLSPNTRRTAQHGAVINIIPHKYKYKVEFVREEINRPQRKTRLRKKKN